MSYEFAFCLSLHSTINTYLGLNILAISPSQVYKLFCRCYGEVSEWLIEPVSKTGVPFAGTAGSNPALSGKFYRLFLIVMATTCFFYEEHFEPIQIVFLQQHLQQMFALMYQRRLRP